MREEVDGIKAKMAALAIGKPPRDADMDHLSGMAKQMLKACESRLQLWGLPLAKDGSESPSPDPVLLQERDAVQRLFLTIKDRIATSDTNITLKHLMPLRQFRWCLDAEQKVEVQGWVRKIAVDSAGEGTAKGSHHDGDCR